MPKVQSRKYHGETRYRDKILEGQIAPSCVVCGVSLERKIYRQGNIESFTHFLNRKTCGKVVDDLGHWHSTDCHKQFRSGAGNSNYKGLMPTCVDCKKRISYPTKQEQKEGVVKQRCGTCFKKWAHETGWYVEHAHAGAIPYMQARKGEIPSQLNGYQFVKGHKALNKKYDFCTIEGCAGKHLAKGLCIKHYEIRRRELKMGKTPAIAREGTAP